MAPTPGHHGASLQGADHPRVFRQRGRHPYPRSPVSRSCYRNHVLLQRPADGPLLQHGLRLSPPRVGSMTPVAARVACWMCAQNTQPPGSCRQKPTSSVRFFSAIMCGLTPPVPKGTGSSGGVSADARAAWRNRAIGRGRADISGSGRRGYAGLGTCRALWTHPTGSPIPLRSVAVETVG